MFNKKLVLGSLAGATLLAGAMIMLPTVAEAAVAGACSNCHTMHATTAGLDNTAGAFDYLLVGGCSACHTGGTNATGTGRDATKDNAPQVDNTGTNMLAGGYFSGTGANQHDTLSLGDVPNLTTSPGGSFVAATLDCANCHGALAHHGTPAVTNYRGLGVTGAGTVPSTIYGVNGDYNAANYSTTGMNSVCTACHGGFHGGTGADTGSASPWIRHPTEVNATTIYTFAGDVTTPIGEDDGVMCISCHRPHGSGFADLLRFDYTDNVAGTAQATLDGCEACHGEK